MYYFLKFMSLTCTLTGAQNAFIQKTNKAHSSLEYRVHLKAKALLLSAVFRMTL